MAYVFNRLANAMGENEGKQNIFGSEGMPGGGQQGPGGQSFGLTGGGGEAGAGGAPAVDDTGESDAKKTANLQSGAQQAQIGALNTPQQGAEGDVYKNIGETIESRENQLQEKAADYTQKAQESTAGDFYGDAATVKKNVSSALGQGAEGYTNLQNFITGGAAPQVEEYKSDISTGDINIPQSQDQLASSLQGQSDRASYSGGQARLDAALLGGSEQFQTEQGQLRDRKESLEGQRIRAEQEAARQQAEAAARYEAQQGGVRDILGELADEMIAAQSSEQEALRNQAVSDADLRSAYEQAAGAYEGSNPLLDYGSYSDVIDPSQFYSRSLSENADDPMAYFDEDERSRYNQLAGLLGRQNATEGQAGYTGEFDMAGYQNAAYAERNRLAEEKRLADEQARARAEAEARVANSRAATPEGIVFDEMRDAQELNTGNLYGTFLGEDTGEALAAQQRASEQVGLDAVQPHMVRKRAENVGRGFQRARKNLFG